MQYELLTITYRSGCDYNYGVIYNPKGRFILDNKHYNYSDALADRWEPISTCEDMKTCAEYCQASFKRPYKE